MYLVDQCIHVYVTLCHVFMCPFSDRTALINHKRKGTGLQKITQGLGTKVTIQIAKGMKRPEKPMQAAKFASECGYTARSLLPVLPHFKEYKNDSTLMKNYVGKVVVSQLLCS